MSSIASASVSKIIKYSDKLDFFEQRGEIETFHKKRTNKSSFYMKYFNFRILLTKELIS